MPEGDQTRPITDEEREKWVAEARKANAEARVAEANAGVAEFDFAKRKREYEEQQTADKFHGVYQFTKPVTEGTVLDCIAQLRIWDRLEPDRDLEIVFDSPGGSVIDGMHLFDFLQPLRKRHQVTTGTLGMAASMAGILLQAGDHRWMGAEAFVLIHQVSTGVAGKVGEIEDEMKFINKISDRVLDIFAARCKEAGERGTALKPLTRAQLKRGWERRDWWLDSGECLKFGLVDEVR